jgi:hypothetical protein
MGVEVRLADESDLEAWDGYVEQSPQGSVFHQYPFLRVLADHSGADLHPLVGYKGQEPVGLFPVFELRKGPVSTAFSPPPQLGIPYLGPVLLNYRKLKQRKLERLNKRFVRGCLDWLDEHVEPKFTRVVTTVDYDDVRPFQWADFESRPRYTYVNDLSMGAEALLQSFDRDARKPVRDAQDAQYTVERRGADGIDFVLDRINSRYDETDGRLRIDPEYVTDLYEALPDGQVRIYVGSVEGRRVSGKITLAYGDTLTMWQGSPKPEVDLDVSINDVSNWEVMNAAIDEGRERSDFTGANTERLCRYKSKFNPEPVSYYELERGTRSMNLVSDLYRRLR